VDKDSIKEMVRKRPEYRDGRLTDEQAEEIASYLEAHKEEILREYVPAEVGRALIRLAARGEVEYDAENERYRSAGN
jgi:plasmid stability protein